MPEAYLNAVSPPIFQTAMFCFKDTEHMRQTLAQESSQPFYTRGVNPTIKILQEKIAALEGAEAALAFASGSAAIAAGIMANVQAGDHIICVQKPYSWTNKLLTQLLPRFGVHTTMVEGSDTSNFEQALQPNTRLIMLESPNSWTFEQQDIAAVVAFAQAHQLLTMIDNSYATPLFQKPIALGVDLVAHSASKYISGHSDTVAGLLCGSQAMMQKIFASEFMTLGGIISPFNAWLLIRGLRTLSVRMQKVSATTAQVVEYLAQQPRVEKIYYPFDPQNPQYDLAQKQMQQGAGQFSIALKADKMEEVEAFCNRLKRFMLACSWGGYESLLFPACVLYSSENYQTKTLPWNLLRFCVGLEEPEELITDLAQALN